MTRNLYFEDSRDPMLTPVWASTPGILCAEAEAAFTAGGSLNPLDRIVSSDAPWLGALQCRLSLFATEASLAMNGKPPPRLAIRDALYLYKPGDDPGPICNMLRTWRGLGEGRLFPDEPSLKTLVQFMNLPHPEAYAGLADELALLSRSIRPLPELVLGAMKMTWARSPGANPLIFWMGDLMLANRMGWPFALPVMSLAMRSSRLLYPDFSPFEDEATKRMFLALSEGAILACRTAAELQKRATILESVLPKVRTKGADRLAKALLKEDAVPSFMSRDGLSRFAVRRFMERLEKYGAITEVSGRENMRLYAL